MTAARTAKLDSTNYVKMDSRATNAIIDRTRAAAVWI